MNPRDLDGHAAIVAGAASGIGAATARALAKYGSGVLVADLDGAGAKEVAESAGDAALACQADVTDRSDVESMVRAALEAFGKIDILVCAAGITGSAPAADTTDDIWERILAVNLWGPFACARAALPHMVERRYGRIVNVASIGGLVALRHDSAYCASKGGLIQLTRSIALDYAANGITANAVCPGVVETPLLRPMLEDEETRRSLLGHTPIRRPGAPEEVAELIAYLSTPSAAFVTGQAIAADGGWTAH